MPIASQEHLVRTFSDRTAEWRVQVQLPAKRTKFSIASSAPFSSFSLHTSAAKARRSLSCCTLTFISAPLSVRCWQIFAIAHIKRSVRNVFIYCCLLLPPTTQQGHKPRYPLPCVFMWRNIFKCTHKCIIFLLYTCIMCAG